MPTITNQANISYNYGTLSDSAVSNIATATLLGPMTVTKSSLNTTYRSGDDLTYTVSVQNISAETLTGVTVSDDLGAYLLGNVTVTPLTYTGPAQLYINGVLSGSIEPTATTPEVVFTVPSLASGSTAMVIYKVNINDSAQLAEGSQITNTVAVSATGYADVETASYTLTVENYAQLNMIKSMSPNPITDGDTVTYTFNIYNYGNAEATNVVLTDTFLPAPDISSVTVNGTPLAAADYSYSQTNGILTAPIGTATSITVPAATFTQNATSGIVTVNPGVTQILVTGTL